MSIKKEKNYNTMDKDVEFTLLLCYNKGVEFKRFS